MRRVFFEPEFRQAAADYYALLNKGYPEKRTRLLVADRYQLNTAQRTVLYRGVFPERVNRRRMAKLLKPAEAVQKLLVIDLLNLMYLLMNYHYGRNLFIATDGVLRDDGENYAEFSSYSIFTRVLELLNAALIQLEPPAVELVVDYPHLPLAFETLQDAAALSEAFRTVPAEVKVHLSAAADKYLQSRTDCVLISADSRIIDRWKSNTFDLGYYILDQNYQADFPNLKRLIDSSTGNVPRE